MKTYSIIPLILFLAFSSQKEVHTRKITGTVISVEDKLPIPGVNVLLKGTSNGTTTDIDGKYTLYVPQSGGKLVFTYIGFGTKEVKIGSSNVINMRLEPDNVQLEEVIVTGRPNLFNRKIKSGKRAEMAAPAQYDMDISFGHYQREPNITHNTEEYDAINENIFHAALRNPLSTFSIDVDAASYANIRRFINNGMQPPKDAVRIEEMVNYFNYDYTGPKDEHPFAVHTEISTAPWNEKHRLVHIGLQGKKIPTENLPASNLVFLLDVSGSMNAPNKLPLLKSAFKLLVNNLREEDRVAIVVYAGAAGTVLPSTPGSSKQKILEALDQLSAGGSTAGGAGINLAYRIAKQNFVKGGNNRVILATDGDFNVGESSNAAMERLIEEKRQDGVFLTVLGFGMGNYKDSKMEILADKGNGNYAYIDNIREANKVLVNEFGGTLFTIAKDVKLQIEFNPTKVQAYRLIGYENRVLRDEDFNNDKKDAGELGSGHTVTALYEIIPDGVESDFSPLDELRYQEIKIDPKAKKSKELMTIKLRYKRPDENISSLIEHPVIDGQTELATTSDNFRWSAAVASFGMLLRESEFSGDASYESVIRMAQGAKGEDKEGYRSEFIGMVRTFQVVATR